MYRGIINTGIDTIELNFISAPSFIKKNSVIQSDISKMPDIIITKVYKRTWIKRIITKYFNKEFIDFKGENYDRYKQKTNRRKG